eukprot:CAMPEP_0182880704 /NCGR_PEP_ID=MMETSP0034_2-20130328/16726_1 /TAXON_ID=156128 /ORGANISM="Nephroselmis pyriformis, Strain CCMP717" /LENGTH=141 /DNA_ID=CAMNT_0025013701 /DNA_START=23 /DNA_END=445 /DNA_ORIENTATION=+
MSEADAEAEAKDDALRGQAAQLRKQLEALPPGKEAKERRREVHVQLRKVAEELNLLRPPRGHAHRMYEGDEPPAKARRKSRSARNEAVAARERGVNELDRLRAPVWKHLDPETGLRRPPPALRVLETRAKARWVGRRLLEM